MTRQARIIDILRIDTSNRLRPINPVWVETLAEAIGRGEMLPPIEIVERGDRFVLASGGHRLAAHRHAGLTEIEAHVFAAADFADEAAIRLREIKENMLRYELTALDRSVHLATWKEIWEAAATPTKRGRKPKDAISEKLPQNSAAIFAGSFSAAAASALRLSERSIQVAVQIAIGIDPGVRERIAVAPIADVQSELLQLAAQHPDRQAKIAALLLAEPPGATSVADAVAIIDRVPAPAAQAPWEKLSDRFARLSEREQVRFFAAHEEAIERWMATRSRRRSA